MLIEPSFYKTVTLYVPSVVQLMCSSIPQGPEEMCLSLEQQNQSKTSEKWAILIVLQFPHTFYIPPSVALWATCRAPSRIWLAVINFQNGEQQSRSGSDKKRRNRLQ